MQWKRKPAAHWCQSQEPINNSSYSERLGKRRHVTSKNATSQKTFLCGCPSQPSSQTRSKMCVQTMPSTSTLLPRVLFFFWGAVDSWEEWHPPSAELVTLRLPDWSLGYTQDCICLAKAVLNNLVHSHEGCVMLLFWFNCAFITSQYVGTRWNQAELATPYQS